MKIAIIGGGFAGLAAAFHLSRFCKVDLFEQKRIGAGASGVSSGLLHPYPGEHGRLSWKADEAMHEARALLAIAEAEVGRPVANYNGIIKKGACIGARSDVLSLEDGSVLIRSGITVFTDLYLQGLWKACEKRGVTLFCEKVENLNDLAHYDAIIIAAGAGIRAFPECRSLKINFLKGQVLTCRLLSPIERSITAKKYTAVTADPFVCHFGSTYERDFSSEEACLEEALRLLAPERTVIDCRAALRVTNPAHYFPIIEKVGEKIWAVTALGSRGLLYHGYLGKMVAEILFKNATSLAPLPS